MTKNPSGRPLILRGKNPYGKLLYVNSEEPDVVLKNEASFSTATSLKSSLDCMKVGSVPNGTRGSTRVFRMTRSRRGPCSKRSQDTARAARHLRMTI